MLNKTDQKHKILIFLLVKRNLKILHCHVKRRMAITDYDFTIFSDSGNFSYTSSAIFGTYSQSVNCQNVCLANLYLQESVFESLNVLFFQTPSHFNFNEHIRLKN